MTMNEMAAPALSTDQPAEVKLERAARLLPRRRFFSDMPDKGLFGIAALGGFAAILWLKLRGFDSDHIAALAVVIMILYGAAAYQFPLVQMRLDRLGDNFYYLGFIYTLASLSAALLQLRAGMQIDLLLGSFGIALVTTIVGIAGRVLFVQLRTELDDVAERARRDLAATSAELRAGLFSSIRDFETFRTGLLQALQETVAASEKTTKLHSERIDELARSTSQHIASAFESNQRQAERLTGLVEEMARAVEKVNRNIASTELPSERLNAELAEFAKGLEGVLRHLASVVDDVARRNFKRRRWYWPFQR